MTDLGASDYGYIHPVLIPEPDSPLTLDWAKAIAKGIARITSYGYQATVAGGGSTFYNTVPSGNNDFNGIPFLKAYFKSGTAWTDYEVIGTGCSVENAPSACSHLGFYPLDGPTDKLRFEWGTSAGVGPIARNGTYVILVYGK